MIFCDGNCRSVCLYTICDGVRDRWSVASVARMSAARGRWHAGRCISSGLSVCWLMSQCFFSGLFTPVAFAFNFIFGRVDS